MIEINLLEYVNQIISSDYSIYLDANTTDFEHNSTYPGEQNRNLQKPLLTFL